MTTHLLMNHYECTIYFINEDPYIYEIPNNERQGEKRPLEFSLSSLSFSLPFFILYNMLSARELIQTKSQNQ